MVVASASLVGVTGNVSREGMVAEGIASYGMS